MDATVQFERSLAEWMAAPFTAGCLPCEGRRRTMADRLAVEWATLDAEQQATWLDTHAGDPQDDGLRAAVEVALAGGRDVALTAEQINARWPRREP